ncbi:MAG TPA: penicillin acylase family protein [Steroidobacteraceae bacterium]|nr:penicillin acylase family protein [Steroidobacteraceae bacterium]
MRKRTIAIVCGALILAPVAVLHGLLRGSLPRLDGSIAATGLTAPVSVDRDAQGVPTIEAANRADLAFGTGFVHGQDRFFQMDLSRRLAAGELSELFGEVAVEQDRKARIFRFRQVAREAVAQASDTQRAVLDAYTRGVNAGLASLTSRPWEYWLLGSRPVAWRAEDTILVSHSMWWDLQYSDFERDIVRQRINARLGGALCDAHWKCGMQFLYPARSSWDAANGGANPAESPDVTVNIPPPEVLNVRAATMTAASARPANPGPPGMTGFDTPPRGIGSNNWVVSGSLTSTGAALMANDMHLTARVPIVWYRARLRIRAQGDAPPTELMGVTLPGAPVLVAGSNGHLAWGFTNSYGQWLNIEPVACTADDGSTLQTAAGTVTLAVQQEEIRVRGKPDVRLAVRTGPAGVLFESHPEEHQCWFATWLAQVPGATNMNLLNLERVTGIEEALAVAPELGIPHQNFVMGDRDGHIAWTIAGRIPTDRGTTRANGASPWTGPDAHPRLVDPPAGRIWTANARATDDSGQEQIIGGATASIGADYDLGARARQIRDDLLALRAPATPADMLRIQLDDRALFLDRWQHLLVELLDADSLAGHPQRAEFRRLIADWNARASVDSVGYRLVREYHERTQAAVWEMILGAVGVQSGEDTTVPSQFEPALWALVNQRPMHMLAARYSDWRQFLMAQLDGTILSLQSSCQELSRCRWGTHEPVRIRHPLSRALPFLAGLLDMPVLELPGDHDMPRVQEGSTGASERFAVSPGHEDQGYFHMPGGQSGHPLSPFYRAGFMDWANGTATPFLPGVATHRLTLQPN